MTDARKAWCRKMRSEAIHPWRSTLQSAQPGRERYVSTIAQPWPAHRLPDAPRAPWLRIACVALIVINAALTVALMKGLP